MNMSKITLSDVINYHDFIFSLCAFIDEFKRSNNKHELISNPPICENDDVDEVNLCILAATSHKLANDYGLPIPEWVEDPLYKMPHPVFAFNTTNEEYQAFLLQDTPYEFASKNIFHGSNCIDRV